MARTEDSKPRRASNMLLARSRSRVSTNSPKRRDKRKKAASANKSTKNRKVKDIKTKGKVSPKTKDTNGSSPSKSGAKGYKRYNKDRKPDRTVEREDNTTRRTASELGIEWIGDYCPDNKPHNLICIYELHGGSLFRCSNCRKYIWLPTFIKDAAKLDSLIDSYGTTTGYCKYLDTNRSAKMLVAKLQDLWYARAKIKDDRKFTKLVVRTMEDSEYDRRNNGT